MNRIFVPLASYLDYEVRHTILDMIDKAKNPENLYFSVILQYDENIGTDKNCIDDLLELYNIKIEKYHWNESEGGCWARQKAQQYYNGEEYILQVDTHSRFIKNWDDILIDNILNLKKICKKPMLSFLPPGYTRDDRNDKDLEFININELDKIQIPKVKFISTEGWIDYVGYENQKNTNYKNVKIPLLYGCFVFAEGQWVVEIEQDPNHYYTGEELALALRSYTHGYDIFTPTQIVAWHRFHNGPNKKHLNTHPVEVTAKKHRTAVKRLQMLQKNEDLGKYSLGIERTIEQYMEFSGLNFFTREITKKEEYV